MEASASVPAQMASCVAVGRFNPAILTPAWIVKEGILPDGETEVGYSPGGGRVQFRLSGFLWQPSLSKLEVHAEEENVDPGSFVAQVLERLPHTPVRGVGNNFALALDPELARRVFPLLHCGLADLIATQGGHECLGKSVTLTLSHENEAILRLTVDSESSDLVSVNFNFHRDCVSASAGVEAARCWSLDRIEARRLITGLLEKNGNATRNRDSHSTA